MVKKKGKKNDVKREALIRFEIEQLRIKSIKIKKKGKVKSIVQKEREALAKQFRQRIIGKKVKRKLTAVEKRILERRLGRATKARISFRREDILRKQRLAQLGEVQRLEPIRRFIPKKPTVSKQLQSFKVFGKIPVVKRPIIDEASRKDVRSAEEIEFLGGETMMFSDDLLGTEDFVPKRVEDL